MTYQRVPISRRSFLSGATAAVAGGVFFGKSDRVRADSDSTGDEQWTQLGGNAASTHSDMTGVGPTGDISIAWDAHESVHGYRGDSSVGAVVDGTVYASGTGLVALDATDGTELWSFGAETPDKEYPESGITGDIETPAVMDGTVFATVRFGVYDADSSVFHTAIVAVDAESGEKQWRIDVPYGLSFSELTAVDGSLFVNGPDMDGGDGLFLYVLNADDGSVQWRQPIQRTEFGTRPRDYYSAPIVADGLVFVAPPNGVNAYDAASGDLVWDALPHVKDLSMAMVSEETLFVSENSRPGATIIALDVRTGDDLWKTAYGGDIRVAMHTIDTERLYISTSEDDSDVVALDRSTGNERWRTTIPQPTNEEQHRMWIPKRGMIRVGELLYVGGAALQPSDGEILWKKELREVPSGGYSLDAVAGGRMYISDRGLGGGLVVLEGTKTQTTTTPTPQPENTKQQVDLNEGTDTSHRTPSDDTTARTDTSHPTQSDNTDQSTADHTEKTDTPNHTQSGRTIQQTAETTPQSTPTQIGTASNSESSTRATDATTATDGPGFSLVTAVAGVGVGAWRYLTTD